MPAASDPLAVIVKVPSASPSTVPISIDQVPSRLVVAFLVTSVPLVPETLTAIVVPAARPALVPEMIISPSSLLLT